MQKPSARPKMTQEQARKTLWAWLRSLVLVLLLFLPARMFLQAGRQIDLNKNLFAAIRRNDANRVGFLLNAGAEANAREALHDNRPMLKQIFDRMRGFYGPPGPSPLLVQLEIKRANRGEIGIVSEPPENIEIVKALLDHHANPDVRRDDDEETPLMMAVQQGKEATVEALLRGGAKVNLRDSQGIDALHFAAEKGTAHIARLLLDAGADINSRDGLVHITPLMEAMGHANEPVITLLKAAGAK